MDPAEVAKRARDKLFRLHSILTEEVSLVDRPANKQPFLVVKREDQMDELKDKGNGELTKQAGPIAPGIKERLQSGLGAALERLDGILKMVKGASTTDERLETPLPSEVGRALRAISTSIKGLLDRYTQTKDEDVVGLEIVVKDFPDLAVLLNEHSSIFDATVDKQISIPGPVKETVTRMLTEAMERLTSVLNDVKGAETAEDSKTLPAGIMREIQAVDGLIRGVAEKYPSPNTETSESDKKQEKKDTEKRGAKMSSQRKKVIMDALKALLAVSKEVGMDLKTVGITKSKEALDFLEGSMVGARRSGTDAHHPNQGSGHQPDVTAVASARQFFADVPGFSQALKMLVEEATLKATKGLRKELQETKDTLEKKDGVVKSLSKTVENQAQAIRKFDDGIPNPPAGGEAEEVGIKKSQSVAWPQDMNSPIEKDD